MSNNKVLLSTQCIIAVDPGESGGIAFTNGTKSFAEPMGDNKYMCELVKELTKRSCVAYMEQVGGFMGDPGKSPGAAMFNFGNGYGYMRGLFAMAGIPCRLIPPQKWMRAVLPGVIGMEKAERKRALKEYAAQLYPELDVTLKTADALVLLEYAKRTQAGGAAHVDIPHKNDYRGDLKRAKKWAKEQGFSIPKGAELIDMVNYWRKHINK